MNKFKVKYIAVNRSGVWKKSRRQYQPIDTHNSVCFQYVRHVKVGGNEVDYIYQKYLQIYGSFYSVITGVLLDEVEPTLVADGTSMPVTLDGKNFTADAPEFPHSFENCALNQANIYSIDFSKIDFFECNAVDKMFYNCTNLEYIDLSGFKADNHHMSSMFKLCDSLKEVHVAGCTDSRISMLLYQLNNAKAAGHNDWYQDREWLVYQEHREEYIIRGTLPTYSASKNIVVAVNGSNYPVIYTSDTEWECHIPIIPIIDLTNLLRGGAATVDCTDIPTSKVVSYARAFEGLSRLSSANISNFSSDSCTDVNAMFKDCSIGTVNLPDFEFKNITQFGSMFSGAGCNFSFKSLNAPNAEDLGYMFENFRKTEINLAGFNFPTSASTLEMFKGCTAKKIHVDGCNSEVINILLNQVIIDECGGTKYWLYNNSAKTLETYLPIHVSGHFDIEKDIPEVFINDKFVDVEVDGDFFDAYAEEVEVTKFDNLLKDQTQVFDVTVHNIDFNVANSYVNMFSGCTNVGYIVFQDDASGGHKSQFKDTDDFTGMFDGCDNLYKVSAISSVGSSIRQSDKLLQDILNGNVQSGLDTWGVYRNNWVHACDPGELSGCTPPEAGAKLPFILHIDGKDVELDVKSDGSYYYQFEDMLTDVDRLLEIDVLPPTGWIDCSKMRMDFVRGINRLMYEDYLVTPASGPTRGGIRGWKTPRVTDLTRAFQNCYVFADNDLSSMDTSNVTSFEETFARVWGGDEIYYTINLSTWDASNVTTMRGMFNNAGRLRTITFGPGFSNSKVTDMSFMFESAYVHTSSSINLRSLDTSNVVTVESMFESFICGSINLGGLDFSHVTNAKNMFRYCYLESLGGVMFNFAPTVNMDGAFDTTRMLKYVDLSGFVPQEGFSAVRAFKSSSVEEVNLSGWKLRDPEEVYEIFRYAGMEAHRTKVNVTGCDADTINILMNSGSGYVERDGNYLYFGRL